RERARPVRLHHPINARTRTEEHGGNLAGGAARGTQQQQVQGQQVPIAGPAQFCQHAGLLSHWNIYYRRFRHSRTSMIARSVWQPSIYQRVRLCANLLCFDLAHGITTVRNTGDFSGTILKQRQQVQDGKYPGPRIFACGPIIDGDPPFWPGSRVVRNVAEAQAVVDEVAAAGVDCVKGYGRLSGELLAAIREAAARHKLPVVGHVPLAVPFEEAHIKDVQHLTGVPVYTNHSDSSKLAQFVGWAAAWRTLDETRMNFIVRTSVEQGLLHTPTLVVWAQMGRLRDYPTLRDDPTAQLLPRWYREVLWRPREAVLPADDDLGAALPKM